MMFRSQGRAILLAAVFCLLGTGMAACGTSSTKSASANPAPAPVSTVSAKPKEPRSTLCPKIDELGLALWGPYLAVDAAGTDKVKLEAATQQLLAAMDNFVTELGKIGEVADTDLQAAISGTIADAQGMRKDIVAAGTDRVKLEAALKSDKYNTGQEQLSLLCAG
jgi:hypothetical protein